MALLKFKGGTTTAPLGVLWEKPAAVLPDSNPTKAAGHTSQPTGRATAGGPQCLTKPRRPAAGNGGQLPGFFMPVRRRAAVSGANTKIGHSPGTPPSRRGAPLPEGLSVSQSPVAPRRATAVSCPGFSCRYGAAQRYQGLNRKHSLSLDPSRV